MGSLCVYRITHDPQTKLPRRSSRERLVPAMVDPTGIEPVTLGVKTSEVAITSTGPCAGMKQKSPHSKRVVGTYADTKMDSL